MSNNWQPHIPYFLRGERLSAERMNELAQAVAHLMWKKQQSSNAAFGVRQPLEIIGKLDDNLPPADSFATTPGTAVMSVYTRDINDELVYQGRKENVKQRFEDATERSAGDAVKARWIEGEWMVDAPAGGTHRIYFEVVDYECVSATQVDLTVRALYYTGGCTTTIPGEDSYGEIAVSDPCGIALYFPAIDLTGKNGFATYMYPRTGYCVGEWLLDDLCGTPECA